MKRRSKRIWAVGFACVAALITARACRSSGPPPPPVLRAGGWAIGANAPVVPAGSGRGRALWNDPSVVAVPGGYTMYATTSLNEPFQPPILPFRFVSRDLKSWKLDPSGPLLQPVAPYASIETPSVVWFRGHWHMLFTGVLSTPDPSPMAIGHAISDDGVHWRVDRPVLIHAAQEESWRSYLVGEPGAVVVGDHLRVYFSAVGARTGDGPPQDQSIGVVESADGVTFSAPRRAFTQTAQFSGAKGYAGYSAPAGIMIGGDLHLFYTVAHFQSGGNPEWRQVAIAEAVSAGGTAPFREMPGAVVSIGDAGWAGGEVIGPSPLLVDGKLMLWFGGHVPVKDLGPLVRRGFQGPEFGIGLATRALPAPDAKQKGAK